MKTLKNLTIFLLAMFWFSQLGFGQLSLTNGSNSQTITFDATLSGVSNGAYSGSGFEQTPSSGRLDSDAWSHSGMSGGDLAFGGTGTSGDNARGSSSGGVSTGGFYAFDTGSSDYCFGIQPGGSDWTPGTIILRIKNDGTTNITQLSVSYEIKIYNNEDRANSLKFSYSSDNSTYTSVPALDYTSTAAGDGSPSWTTVTRNTTISSLSITSGSYYYLKWDGDDVSGSGSRDEFGIDDIAITATFATASDTDSEASSPTGGQQSGGTISSLDDTEGEAVAVFKFDIDDTDNGDTKDTKVTNIRIKPNGVNNTADWTDNIQGIKLNGSTLGDITINSTTINDTYIDLAIISSNLDVPHGTSETITMSVFLNTSNVEDGETLSFMIDADDHNFTADASGSTFSDPFSTDVTSNNFTITVVATKFSFIQQPSDTEVDGTMSPAVTIEATDANGNRDLDKDSGTASLTSSGTMTGTPTASFSDGIGTFSSIVHTVFGTNLTLTGSDGSLTDAISNNFDITGSNSSDIVINSSFTYTSDIDYTSYQGNPISNTSHSIGLMKFDIRDGGASDDDDNLPTILDDITFSSIIGIANIRQAALFDGNSHIANATSISGTDIVFTNLPTTDGHTSAPDNDIKSLTLRVSFLTTVTDNEQLSYTITDANVTAAGSNTSSTFGSFSDVTSSTTGDRNRIEVDATKLLFTQQPSTTDQDATMTPAIAVEAVDDNDNRDLDNTATVSLSSTGTMTAVSDITLSNGTGTFGNVVHTVTGTNLTLAATTGSLADVDPSNQFDITAVTYSNHDFRTTGSGTWVSNNGTPDIWEEYNGSTWVDNNNSPTYNTSHNIYIRNGNTITSGGSFGTSVNIIIEDGGVFNDDHQGTAASVLVKDGGTLKINDSFTIASGGTFEVEDNGNVEINFEYSNPNSSIWQGTENFHPNSNFKFVKWDVADDLYDGSNITSNTYLSYEAIFGNIELDLTLSSSSGDWEMIQGSSAINMNLCHNNLKLTNLVNKNINVCGTNDITTGIGGDFIINSTGTRNIRLLRNGNSNFTIEGDFIQTGGDFRFITPTTDDETSICSINGNMSLTGGSTSMNNAAFSEDITTTINLKGNLTISSGSSTGLKNSSEDSYASTSFNFTGTTTQYVNTELNFDKIPTFVKSGAIVQLQSNNLVLDNTSKFTVEDGGTLYFGWDDDNTTPLLVIDDGTPTGTNTFTSNQGSTLSITSADGISSGTADEGNVQLPIADKSFHQTAIFHYVGKANQVTGDAITTTSTGKRIIVELATNTTELTITNSINITNSTSLGAAGGYLDIIKGTLKEIDDANDFIIEGTGSLLMSDGKYIIPLKSSSSSELIPRLSNSYTITGGEIELSSNEQYDGATTYGQILRGSRDYYSLTFSGGGDKVLSSSLPVNSLDGEVYIYDDNTQLDIENREFSGSADLLMDDNSLFRMNKLSAVLPQLSGSYFLAGGTVEIYGTNNSQTHSIRGVDGSKGTITYNNIEINADDANIDFQDANVVAGANFNVDGIMNVNSPACFKIGATYHIGGSGTFDLKSGATLKYGSTDGIVTSSATGNIRTSTRTFNTGASYGLTGTSSPQNTGNALPSSINNFYLEKTDNTDIVTLNTVQINGDMILREGILKINSDNLTPIVCDDINGNGDVFIEAGAFLEILANKALTVEGTISNTQGVTGLVLKSDATGTGSLIQSNSVVATVERYITGDNWHTMFPTLDAIPKSTYTSEGTQTNNNFYSYDETTKDYWNSSATFETTGWTSEVGSGNLRVDKGFIYNRVGASTRIVSQTGGSLFVGNKDFTITNTTNSGTIDNSCASGWSNYDGWNLVGNPYASAIDWDKVAKTGIDNAVYVYDDSVDKYKVYGTDNYSGVGTSTGGGSQFIPSGQGFYVKKTSSGSSTFTLDATTSDDREHNSQGFLKGNPDKDFVISNFLRLEIEKDGYNDDIVIRTLPNESGVTNGHDSEFDAYKMFAWNNDKPQLYSKNNANSNYYAINSLPIFTENTIVPLGVHIGVSGEYEINLTENYFDNMHVWLEDKSLFVNTNLLNNSSYTFNQVAEQNNDRFYLHFDLNHKPILNIEIPDQVTNKNEYYSYTVADNAFDDVDFEDVLTLSATLSDGNELPTWLTFNSETKEFSGIPEDIQVVNIKVTATDVFGEYISEEYQLTVKSAMSVSEITDNEIAIYPNPANDIIYVELPNNLKSQISIVDVTGQILYTSLIYSQKSEIDLSRFSKGVYFVEIKFFGKSVVKKIIIE